MKPNAIIKSKFYHAVLATGFIFLFFISCQPRYKQEYKDAYSLKNKGDLASLEAALIKFNDAIRYAIMATDGKFETLKALGIKLIQAEMFLEAAKYFEEARLVQPTSGNTYYYLGLCYANHARIEQDIATRNSYIEKAENTYLAGIVVAPSDPVLHYSLGILIGFLKENPNEGVKHVVYALQLEPRNLKAIFAAGNLYYQMGKIHIAAEYYRKILEMAETDSEEYIKAQDNLNLIKIKNR